MSQAWNPYASSSADLVLRAEAMKSEPAGRWTRLAAKLLDVAPFLCIGIVVAIGAASTLGGATDEEALAQWMMALAGTWGVILGVVGIAWMAYTIHLMHTRGQTWGKKVMGIKVVRSDGSRLSLGRWIALRVVVLGGVSSIPFIGSVISLIDPLMIFREDRRCLHDLLADTIVVQAS